MSASHALCVPLPGLSQRQRQSLYRAQKAIHTCALAPRDQRALRATLAVIADPEGAWTRDGLTVDIAALAEAAELALRDLRSALRVFAGLHLLGLHEHEHTVTVQPDVETILWFIEHTSEGAAS